MNWTLCIAFNDSWMGTKEMLEDLYRPNKATFSQPAPTLPSKEKMTILP